MTKKLLLVLAALLSFAPTPANASADTNRPLTYVSVSSFTLTGNQKKVWVLQNTSATLDVRLLKLDVVSMTSGSVTSGPVEFWLFASTAATAGGTLQTAFYDNASANLAQPSYIAVSTGPVLVTYESKLPIFRPLVVNADESAAANFRDSFDATAPADGGEILLPHGANRGVVLEQRQLGATDWTAGDVMVRAVINVR